LPCFLVGMGNPVAVEQVVAKGLSLAFVAFSYVLV
jgi:hypothetical protein